MTMLLFLFYFEEKNCLKRDLKLACNEQQCLTTERIVHLSITQNVAETINKNNSFSLYLNDCYLISTILI